MTALGVLHFIAEWLLILLGAGFVASLLWIALCLLGDPAEVETPCPAPRARMRCYRGRDGTVRFYHVVRADADELYLG
jgi:hypothetical protein